MSNIRKRSKPPRGSREKRALSDLAAATWVAGDEQVCDGLVYALNVRDLAPSPWTHGFHSYPARMHWGTVARLLEVFSLQGTCVLDPFCGSGTTLVETRRARGQALGVDLNPLAVRLAELKAGSLTQAECAQLRAEASLLRARSEERVRARDGVQARLPKSEVAWYQPHVLKELAGLFEEIEALPGAALREAMTLVFSAIVVKFSRQRSDTSEQLVERRLRKGLVSEFFERRAHELASRLEELARFELGPRAQVRLGDARNLADLLPGRVDAIITSPPYGGTYDYVAQHQRRLAWLGLDGAAMRRAEIGARRDGQGLERFQRDMARCLRGMGRVLHRDGVLLMLMGDGRYGEDPLPADELIASLAPAAGFRPLAVASRSQRATDGHGARREHLMALLRV